MVILLARRYSGYYNTVYHSCQHSDYYVSATEICINFVGKVFVSNFRVTIFSFISNMCHIFVTYSITNKKNSRKNLNFHHFAQDEIFLITKFL